MHRKGNVCRYVLISFKMNTNGVRLLIFLPEITNLVNWEKTQKYFLIAFSWICSPERCIWSVKNVTFAQNVTLQFQNCLSGIKIKEQLIYGQHSLAEVGAFVSLTQFLDWTAAWLLENHLTYSLFPREKTSHNNTAPLYGQWCCERDLACVRQSKAMKLHI